MAVPYWRPPLLSSRGLASLLQKHFPFVSVKETSISELVGYDDRNYKFSGRLKSGVPHNGCATIASNSWFVAKFLNSRDSRDTDVVDGLVEIVKFVYNKVGIKCPYPIPSSTGYEVVKITHNDLLDYTNDNNDPSQETTNTDSYYCLRVHVYIDGDVLGYGDHSVELLHQLGKCLGTLDKELMAFTHEGLVNRHFEEWDLKFFSSFRKQVPIVKDQHKEEVLNKVLDYFEAHIVPVIDKIECGCIHADFNAMNIIVNTDQSTLSSINGIIDFSDCLFAPHVFDLGISLSYTMARKAFKGEDPINYVKPIIDGYLSVHPLSSQSLDILYYVILARAAQSFINSCISYEKEPTNEYVLIDSEPLWHLINVLLSEGKEKIYDIWGIKNIKE